MYVLMKQTNASRPITHSEDGETKQPTAFHGNDMEVARDPMSSIRIVGDGVDMRVGFG
jgi:hypothetical protein